MILPLPLFGPVALNLENHVLKEFGGIGMIQNLVLAL